MNEYPSIVHTAGNTTSDTITVGVLPAVWTMPTGGRLTSVVP